MFFNKHKEIAEKLTLFVLLRGKDLKGIDELKSQINLPNTETNRLLFCLYILRLSSVVFFALGYESNRDKVHKIVDSMFDVLESIFELHHGWSVDWKNEQDMFNTIKKISGFKQSHPEQQTRLRIGDYIIHPTEKRALNSIERGINDDTTTNYHTLVPFAYNIREPQYAEAIRELAVVCLEKRNANHWVFDPVTTLFVEHFTGKKPVEFDIGYCMAF